ncbi:MAG: helix-turn-helix transcriptional regulator [Deltaproteobacteria bacterium]|nr:helix-turn-helix transcriptional regulator [Deltaproteobacteria bacterium]
MKVFSCERLKVLRKKRGLTQEQLARQADITAHGYVMLENGHRGPLVSTLAKLADALDVTPNYFFKEVKNSAA